MGSFSSSKTYIAHAASSPLFEELPGSFKSNILQTSFTGESKAGAILYTINTDQFARAKSQMRYAAREENGYIRGLPTSNADFISIDPVEVAAALTRAVGPYDLMLSTTKGLRDEGFFLAKAIQDLFLDTSYFPWVTAPLNTHWNVDLEEIQIPEINPLDGSYYTSNNDYRFLRDAETPNSSYQVSLPYIDKDGEEQAWDVLSPISIDPLITGENWVMVSYKIGEEIFYWTYKVGSGVDPVFEAAMLIESRQEAFLPVAVLMQDRVWFDEDPESELAKSTNRFMKKLGTSGTEVREGFQEQEAIDDAENDNKKSNAEKWDFFVHYAVPLNTRVRGAREYLWYFFEEMRGWSTQDSGDYYSYLASGSKAQPTNELTVKEAGDNGYNVSFRWSFIEKKFFPGEFLIKDPRNDELMRPLRPREVTSELVEREQFLQPEYQEIVDSFFGASTQVGDYNDETKWKDDKKGFHSFFIVTKALENGSGYERMIVMGLSMQYTINTRDVAKGKNGYRYRYATPTLFGLEEETEEFRIPMLWNALEQVPVLHREEAVAEGLTATVFLVETRTLKWYQTGFWKWVVIIIAVVLIVLSIIWPGGQGFTAPLAAWLGGFVGGSALVIFVIHTVLVFALGYIYGMAASNLGGIYGKIFLIIVAIVAFYNAGGFKDISKNWNAALDTPGWGTAGTLLRSVEPLYNMGFDVYRDYTIAKYEDEFRDFMKDAKERQQELEDAWANFGPVPAWLDPLDLVTIYTRVGTTEQPDAYLDRTLNTNPGILGYELVYNFFELAVMLPEEAGQQTIISGMIDDFEKQRG